MFKTYISLDKCLVNFNIFKFFVFLKVACVKNDCVIWGTGQEFVLKSCVLFPRYSSFWIFNYLMIYFYMRQGAFFNIFFELQLMESPDRYEQGQLITWYDKDMTKDNLANWLIWARTMIFRNHLNNLKTGVKLQVLFNLATCSSTSYVKIPVLYFFWKGAIKNGKCQLLKMARSYCFIILIKS